MGGFRVIFFVVFFCVWCGSWVRSDLEVFPDYQRSPRDESTDAKWSELDFQPEDAQLDRIRSLLDSGSPPLPEDWLVKIQQAKQVNHKPYEKVLQQPQDQQPEKENPQVVEDQRKALLVQHQKQKNELHRKLHPQGGVEDDSAEQELLMLNRQQQKQQKENLQRAKEQQMQEREQALQQKQQQQQQIQQRQALLRQQQEQDRHQQLLILEDLEQMRRFKEGKDALRQAQEAFQPGRAESDDDDSAMDGWYSLLNGAGAPEMTGIMSGYSPDAQGSPSQDPRHKDFTFSFPQQSSKSSSFAVSPADPRFYQPDPRLDLFSRQTSRQDDDYEEDPGTPQDSSPLSSEVPDLTRNPARSSILRSAGVANPDLPEITADFIDELNDFSLPKQLFSGRTGIGEDPVAVDRDPKVLLEQKLAREMKPSVEVSRSSNASPNSPTPFTPPPTSERIPVFKGSGGSTELGDVIYMTTSQDSPVKKQLVFPKNHWFFGMDDVSKLAIVIGCSVLLSLAILVAVFWQYKLHRNSKAAADVEYPAYGVTGPNKEVSPTGDRRLAQSAQMYHYQHQKQQIIAMESSRSSSGRRGSMSEAESEDENEEGDYTVYECPGLAPTGEMEVKNPLFQDDPTPATPAAGAVPEDANKDESSSADTKP